MMSAMGHRPRRRVRVAVALLAAAAGLGACSAPPPDLPATIGCTYQYRPAAGASAGERSGTVEVLGTTGPATAPAVTELPDFRMEVVYVAAGPEGASVRIAVDDPAGEPLHHVLYQVGAGADLRSSTSHGFTGLHYVYSGPAELQYFCLADG
jgi:hypothetical protein